MESCLLYNYTAVPLVHTVWSWTSFLRELWCSVSCYLARLLPEIKDLTVHKRCITFSAFFFHQRTLHFKTSTATRTICGVRVRASVILAETRDSRRHGPFVKKTLILFVVPPKIFNEHCFQFLLGLTSASRETENSAYAAWVNVSEGP